MPLTQANIIAILQNYGATVLRAAHQLMSQIGAHPDIYNIPARLPVFVNGLHCGTLSASGFAQPDGQNETTDRRPVEGFVYDRSYRYQNTDFYDPAFLIDADALNGAAEILMNGMAPESLFVLLLVHESVHACMLDVHGKNGIDQIWTSSNPDYRWITRDFRSVNEFLALYATEKLGPAFLQQVLPNGTVPPASLVATYLDYVRASENENYAAFFSYQGKMLRTAEPSLKICDLSQGYPQLANLAPYF